MDYRNWWSISTHDLANVIIQVSIDTSKISNHPNMTIFEHGEITNLIVPDKTFTTTSQACKGGNHNDEIIMGHFSPS